MFSKVQIFNLALSALLLSKQINDAETDKSNEASVLRTHWDVALRKTLQDLDLDCTFTSKALELVSENPNDYWSYAYKYPNDCAFLRRIESAVRKDNRTTRIERQVGNLNGTKVIFTDEVDAWLEYIPYELNLNLLNASAGMALAYQLAFLSAPLVTGKGAAKLREEIMQKYIFFKSEAQEHDRLENETYEDPETDSEFVAARML